jgi:hypothetical protein
MTICRNRLHRNAARVLRWPLALPVAGAALLAPVPAAAQAVCPLPVAASGLSRPLSIVQSNQSNLLVSESGTPTPNTGRISVVGPDGRRTLLDGLPSGISDVGDPAGPAGLFMRGRTLYVLIGIGDSIKPGPLPRTAVANPTPSSPIFSSVLAMHFSARAENATTGFTMSTADQTALAAGARVVLFDGAGDRLTIELVANFPNYIAEPTPLVPDNVRGSNPFDLVVVDDQVYVTDGGRNLVWQVDRSTGVFSALATFPPIVNPIFPVGPPVIEAVPTGIASADGSLLVTLFRGAPFAPGTSVVEEIDPLTGTHAPLITGLKTAIDVRPISSAGETEYLVLQHSSGPEPFFVGPGVLLRFETPTSAPVTVSSCLDRPTSMVRDKKSGTVYVTELLTGRVVVIH